MNRRLAMMTLAPCLALGLAAATALAATDNAGNAPYADGWQAGDNGGTGFGPWTFGFSGDAGALVHPAPQFIDTAPALTGNSLGAPAFALTTSDRAFFGDTSEANRDLSSPLPVGQTFHLDVDGSALDPGAPGFSIGNTVQLLGTDGAERWGMFTNNGYLNDNWVATSNNDTGVAAGSAFHIAMTLTGVNTFNLVLTPIGGGAPLYSQTGATLGGTAGLAIDSVRLSAYGTGSSADGSKELFFNNMVVTPEPSAAALALAGAVALMGIGRRRAQHC